MFKTEGYPASRFQTEFMESKEAESVFKLNFLFPEVCYN